MDVCNDVYLPGLARCFIIMKVWQASRLVPPRPQVKFLCRAAGKTDPLHYISLSIAMTRPRGVTHFDEMTNTHIICFPAGNRSTDYTSPVLTLSKWFIHYDQCGGLLSNYYQLETSCTLLGKHDASGNGASYGGVNVLSTYMCPLDIVQGKPPSWGKIHLRSHEDERADALEG